MGNPRSPSSAACSSPPTAGSASAVYDRSPAVGLDLPIVAALSGHDGVGQAGHRCPMAPSRLPPVLAMALQIRTAVTGSRSSGFDSADEHRQPVMGRCVQQRLARSVGDNPTKAKASSLVAWMAGRRETNDLKPID